MYLLNLLISKNKNLEQKVEKCEFECGLDQIFFSTFLVKSEYIINLQSVFIKFVGL